MLDIRTHASHDNSGFAFTDAPDAILFDYVDSYGDSDQPSVMLAVLYPSGLDHTTTCEASHDIEPGQPLIDIPDYSGIIMCPAHFHDSATD